MYQIEQQIKTTTTTKLVQKFPQEHSVYCITSLLQINSNTLVSTSWSDSRSPSNPDDNVIVIWSKSKSSPLYEPLQRITQKEAGGDIWRLVLLNQEKEEEEEFASYSDWGESIIIWRRGKGEEFRIKQKIENVKYVQTLLYIANELISGSNSYPSSLLQIWSPSSSSSSSSDFVERQKIEIPSSSIWSLCQINKNNDSKRRIEFASGHSNGQIMIWSKSQINESNYSSIRTLKPFNKGIVNDLIFLNDNGFACLIACCLDENKIVIHKGEEEEEKEVLKHKSVTKLISMSNGQFASGGAENQCLNIWTPSSSS